MGGVLSFAGEGHEGESGGEIRGWRYLACMVIRIILEADGKGCLLTLNYGENAEQAVESCEGPSTCSVFKNRFCPTCSLWRM